MTRPPTIGLDPLLDLIEGFVPGPERAVVGIAGAPGAGKTTLTLALLEGLRRRHGRSWAAHVPMDGYHLADAQLDRLGLRDRKGAPETFDAGGYAAMLERLRTAEEVVYVPGFERDLEQPIAAALHVPTEARVILTEGNYLLLPGWERARAALDEVWFVSGDDDVRRARLVARHEQFGKSPDHAARWVDTVDEPNSVLVTAGQALAHRQIVNGADGWRLHVASA